MHTFRHHRACAGRTILPAFYLDALEPRVLLTAFSRPDVAGDWNLIGTTSLGDIIFDAAGHVTGGSVLQSNGSVTVPSGNYTITSNGAFTLGANKGQMNGSKDVIAASKASNTNESLTVLVNPRAAVFSLGDLNGTWHLEFNGGQVGNNGYGTVTFDGNGNVTGGSATTGAGTTTITGGSYTQSGNKFDIQLTTGDGSNPHIIGWLNASKDILAADPPAANFPGAIASSATNVVMMVRSTGVYTGVDAGGTWRFQGDGTQGVLTLDKHGHITSGRVTLLQGTSPITGTYSLNASGLIRITAKTRGERGGQQTIRLDGAINSSRDVLVMNATSAEDNLTVAIKTAPAVNHAPVIKSIAPFSTAIDTIGFPITFAQLAAHAKPTDQEGDAVTFIVASLGVGSFTLDGQPAPAAPFAMLPGDTLVWTPPSGAKGSVPAFVVKATDGTAASAAKPVIVTTALFPTVNVVASVATASESNNGTNKGVGQFTFKRANGDTSKPLTITYVPTGTAVNGANYKTLSGSITIPAGKLFTTLPLVPINDHATTGNLTVILTVQPGANYATASSSTAMVTIKDIGV